MKLYGGQHDTGCRYDDCPDKKGIETEIAVVPADAKRSYDDCPDKKGIETTELRYSRLPTAYCYDDCPDKKGIETELASDGPSGADGLR